MPGCRRCNGCPGYRRKDLVSQILSKIGGGPSNNCANCQCHACEHY